MDFITLANGVQMPQLGLGVYKMTDPEQTLQAIDEALKDGYRAIDTASFYNNEQQVGEAVRASDVAREDLFITTKVWNDDQGYDSTLRAFEASLKNLNMEYLDLYLTHWPIEDKFVDTYRAIEHLYEQKLIRVPGVSNHHQKHLATLEREANVMPMVNQIEMHPYLQQNELRAYCAERNIAITAWSPLGRGVVLDDEVLAEVAKRYGKTPAQIILRWHVQQNVIVIPKSVTPSRIKSNITIFDFELRDEDMRLISNLNQNKRFGVNPELPDFAKHFK
ncbi:MAG TPA: aldo/keto reductase [Metalysinibacillus sp.]